MDVIEKLKHRLMHDVTCRLKAELRLTDAGAELVGHDGCDCTHRDLLAFLDRLREPTEEMKKALLDAPGQFTPVYFAQVYLAAAQEGL